MDQKVRTMAGSDMSKIRGLGLAILAVLFLGMAFFGYQFLTAQPGIIVTLEDPAVQKKFEQALISHRVQYKHPMQDRFVVDAPSIEQLHNDLPDFYQWSEERFNSRAALPPRSPP